MFIDEQTRTVQKHILDVLKDHTGMDGGQLHSSEVERFRMNPQGAELSNFFYCRELKLKSWYQTSGQPTAEQKQALWDEILQRCGAEAVAPPDDLGPATDVSSLVRYLSLNAHCSKVGA